MPYFRTKTSHMYKWGLALALLAVLAGCRSGQQVEAFQVPEDTVLLEPIDVAAVERPYRATEAKVNNLLHTRLEVTPVWERTQLEGLATLTFQPYFYPTDRLILDAKGMDILSVALRTDSATAPLEFDYDQLLLDITLDRSYTRFEQYTIEVAYVSKPEELNVKGSAAITDAKGLYFINADGSNPDKPTQLWTQGQTEASSCWFPTIDQPNERTTQEIFITVDDRYKTLSNGELVYSNFNADGTRTDYWKQDQSHPPYLFMMAIGEFVIAMDRWEDRTGKEIMVNYYVEPEYSDYAYHIFGNTPEMLSFYSEVLDYDYPWPKYSQVVVRDYVSGAMENTTATIHGEFLNQTARELLDENNEDIIAHELFHHWFGDLVTCESWSNLPLNESFATYGEYLWNEHKYGRDEAELWRFGSMSGYLGEASFKQVPLIRFEYDDKEDMFDAHSYNKGGCVLHMLRKTVGDEAFFASLNRYLKEHAYQDAEVHNLRIAFEETTGLDLNPFFDQWFLGAGHPVLDIWYEADSTNEMTVHIQQVQGGEQPVFHFPLSIDVYTKPGVERFEIMVDEAHETLKVPGAKLINNIVVDAEQYLLCEKQDQKPAAWYLHQIRFAPEFLDRKTSMDFALDSASAVSAGIVEIGLGDTFWKIRQWALEGVAAYGAEHADWQERVLELMQDEKSQVRAEALVASAKAFGDLHREAFFAALNDQSYLVVAAALNAICRIDAAQGLAEAKVLESEEGQAVQGYLAEIYATYGGPEQDGFFRRKLDGLNGFGRYELTQLYGEYLSRQPLEIIDAGNAVILETAKTGSPWWTKLSAYQAWGMLRSELEERTAKHEAGAEEALAELNALISSTKQQESDPRITNMVGAE